VTKTHTVFAVVAAVFVIAACGGSSDPGDAAGGQVSVTLDGTTYSLPARCREYDGEINVFSVDDGSGVEIAARQMGSKLNLDVFVDDGDYSTPKLDQWQRTDSGLEGSGRLYLDDAEDYQAHPVSFEARCD
jgi:ABC-type glycerol-3-phosphate transport system substrate-binding protein